MATPSRRPTRWTPRSWSRRPCSAWKPKRDQSLRILYTREPLPADRESLFWLNVLEVPPKPADLEAAGTNYLQLARAFPAEAVLPPEGLQGDPLKAPAQLTFRAARRRRQRAGRAATRRRTTSPSASCRRRRRQAARGRDRHGRADVGELRLRVTGLAGRRRPAQSCASPPSTTSARPRRSPASSLRDCAGRPAPAGFSACRAVPCSAPRSPARCSPGRAHTPRRPRRPTPQFDMSCSPAVPAVGRPVALRARQCHHAGHLPARPVPGRSVVRLSRRALRRAHARRQRRAVLHRRQMLDQLGLPVPSSTKPRARAWKRSDGCVALPDLIPDATATYDQTELRLDVTVPQAWRGYRARGYVSPEQWDRRRHRGAAELQRQRLPHPQRRRRTRPPASSASTPA